MIKEQKYVVPETEVLELKFEGVICESGLEDPDDFPINHSNPFGA